MEGSRLSRPDELILAVGMVKVYKAGPSYAARPFRRETDFAISNVNDDPPKL